MSTMTPISSLKSFLITARKALLSPPSSGTKPLTFVIGNESADLDSLCSAIALAYLRSHIPPHNKLHIPLANLYRPDLVLRPEMGAVLKKAGVEFDDLLTLTEFDQVEDLEPQDTRWVLVDHNALTGSLRDRFGDRVVGCVDHHDDEGVVPLETGDEPRIVQKCGSCMTLVAKSGGDVWRTMADQMQRDQVAQLAHLVLGPILIDTTNLTSKDKTTPTDVRAVESVEGVLKELGVRYDRDAYHKELSLLKEDLSSLSYRDIFRKDYKSWKEGGFKLGTSSVSQGLHYLLERIGEKDKLLTELKKWADEQELDIVTIFTTLHPQGGFARELMVWALNDKAVKVVKDFVKSNSETLGLETWEDGQLDDTSSASQWRACWRQLRTEHSRKQTAPMLREAMKRA
ncbi:Exopolyphosphatase [Coniochaeta pulveracea]|uniref:Exopolyphosphatase n=1 Tax=Coniochaeta pulveracea TaxID=177199 RepID=A0A420YH58_9PEZI|nr:Exopolyphosphatase [Coniochaeta pulveracea]